MSSSETSADRDAVRTALEPVADQLEPCVDHESELREQLTRSRVVEAQLREQIEQARLAVAERDASLDAIRSTRAWRAVTRWWSFKRHLTARW